VCYFVTLHIYAAQLTSKPGRARVPNAGILNVGNVCIPNRLKPNSVWHSAFRVFTTINHFNDIAADMLD